jgi:hypothetical protein
MKAIISRYVVPYLMIMALAISVMGMAVFYLEGWPVYLTFAAFMGFAVGTIPFLIYQDYRTVMKYVNNAKEAHKAGTLRENVFETAGVFASELSGVPSFIIDPIVKKMNAQFPSQKAA